MMISTYSWDYSHVGMCSVRAGSTQGIKWKHPCFRAAAGPPLPRKRARLLLGGFSWGALVGSSEGYFWIWKCSWMDPPLAWVISGKCSWECPRKLEPPAPDDHEKWTREGDGSYHFIINAEAFFHHFFGVVWSGDELRCTACRWEERSHVHPGLSIVSFDVDAGNVEVLTALAAYPPSQALLKQHILPKLQVDHQIYVCDSL